MTIKRTRKETAWLALLAFHLSIMLIIATVGPVAAKPLDDRSRAAFLSGDRQTIAEVNFVKLAKFYGLRTTTIDAQKFGHRGHLPIMAVDAGTLAKLPGNGQTMVNLRRAVESGTMLLILDVKGDTQELGEMGSISTLTDGQVFGAMKSKRAELDFSVRQHPQEITKELGGLKIKGGQSRGAVSFLDIKVPGSALEPLITAVDSRARQRPVFVRYKKGKGEVFLLSSEQVVSLGRQPMYAIYQPQDISQIVPIMMFLRYAGSDWVWHRDKDYANFTIDDPPLIEPYGNLSYPALLKEMRAHNFHTTIAFIPWNYDRAQQRVIDIFEQNPTRYSLVVHGNNHDDQEFYRLGNDGLPVALPWAIQAKNISQGSARMERFTEASGLPYSRVMVFPRGNFTVEAMRALKRENFLATVNIRDQAINGKRPADYDYAMRPAIMDYESFATILRLPVVAPDLIEETAFSLFIDRPAIISTHQDFFQGGAGAFNETAEQINALGGNAEWKSLEEIANRLYLEKRSEDDDVDIMMFTNRLILTNPHNRKRLYHIEKKETKNVPISNVRVAGRKTDYVIEQGVLRIDTPLAPRSSAEISIEYQSRAFATVAVSKDSLSLNGARIRTFRVLSEIRDRYFSVNGPGKIMITLYYQIGLKKLALIFLAAPLAFLVWRLKPLSRFK